MLVVIEGVFLDVDISVVVEKVVVGVDVVLFLVVKFVVVRGAVVVLINFVVVLVVVTGAVVVVINSVVVLVVVGADRYQYSIGNPERLFQSIRFPLSVTVPVRSSLCDKMCMIR